VDAVEEIKSRIDIVDFISRYTPLQKAGSTYKANCPFHDERTPSFVVFPHTNTWHCFGACSTGGDVFTFVMRKEQLDFREALHVLADETGVDLGATRSGQSERQRTSLYEINAAAADYFREILLHHAAAHAARGYLHKRQIDAATAESFQLGYALDAWDALRNHLDKAGYSIEDQLAAGLLKRNEERGTTYDAFRGRLIFPIRDRQGRIIGFGGRVLDDSQPKYLNTAETAVFQKSRVIYGLDRAYRAIRAAQRVVIVEGYMDVIAAHQHGFTNVVACMGTSLTPEQLRQLQRFTDNYVLALDADTAGQQATVRGLNRARQALVRINKPRLTATGRVQMEERLGANLFIAAMPEGRDPDDVIRTDLAQWQSLLDGAQPLVDYHFDIVASHFDLHSARGKGAAVSELAPLIAELRDEIEQQHYIQRLSRLIQIDEQTVLGRVRAAGQTLRATQQRQRNTPSQQTITRQEPTSTHRPAHSVPDEDQSDGRNDAAWVGPSNADESMSSAHVSAGRPPLRREDYLLATLLYEPDLLIWLAGAAETLEIVPLNANDFQTVENQEIFRALKQFITSDEQWDVELFQETLTQHLHARLADLLGYMAQQPARSMFELREHSIKVLLQMRIERLKREFRTSRYLHEEAQREGRKTGERSLFSNHNHNLREQSHLERVLAGLNRLAFGTERPISKIQF